jgi:hypothetical protein
LIAGSFVEQFEGVGEVFVEEVVVEEFSDELTEDTKGEMLLSRTRPKEVMNGKERMSWLGEIPISETRYFGCSGLPSAGDVVRGGDTATRGRVFGWKEPDGGQENDCNRSPTPPMEEVSNLEGPVIWPVDIAWLLLDSKFVVEREEKAIAEEIGGGPLVSWEEWDMNEVSAQLLVG